MKTLAESILNVDDIVAPMELDAKTREFVAFLNDCGKSVGVTSNRYNFTGLDDFYRHDQPKAVVKKVRSNLKKQLKNFELVNYKNLLLQLKLKRAWGDTTQPVVPDARIAFACVGDDRLMIHALCNGKLCEIALAFEMDDPMARSTKLTLSIGTGKYRRQIKDIIFGKIFELDPELIYDFVQKNCHYI